MQYFPLRARAFVAIVATALLALTACGGDDSPTPTPTSPATASPTVSATVVSSETADPTPGESQTPSASASATATGSETPSGTLDPNAGLTVYSGRTEDLVGPIIERFGEETGIDVSVRYGGTAELAATILEEGDNSPADVFFAQDAGALGAMVDAERLVELPDDILGLVPAAYRSPAGTWVGISGRARTVVYNTERVDPADLPTSILGFTEAKWRDRVGWAPTNGSFQAFVTALRLLQGDDEARAWLEGMEENGVRTYENNVALVQAVAAGEIDAAFVNHYYLFRFLEEEGDSFPARNFYTAPGDPGSLVNVAGLGILKTSEHREAAEQLARFLLSVEAQQYFAEQTFEYPLVAGVAGPQGVPSLGELQPPAIDLSNLDDLEGTLELLQETGVLP